LADALHQLVPHLVGDQVPLALVRSGFLPVRRGTDLAPAPQLPPAEPVGESLASHVLSSLLVREPQGRCCIPWGLIVWCYSSSSVSTSRSSSRLLSSSVGRSASASSEGEALMSE